MGQDLMQQLPQPGPGMMGPRQEAMALNSPTPQMQNMARGQDPDANGIGNISPNLGKDMGKPAAPRPRMLPGGPGGPIMGGGEESPNAAIAQALMSGGRRGRGL